MLRNSNTNSDKIVLRHLNAPQDNVIPNENKNTKYDDSTSQTPKMLEDPTLFLPSATSC